MAWSPSQYVKFEDERTRPARDLLAQVPLDTLTAAVDLGCGPGNSTELLIQRYGTDVVSGCDNDPNMLHAATKRLVGTHLFEADLATWKPEQPVDLLFALFAPKDDTGVKHLRALARVSRLLRQGDLREQLRQARTADAIHALLVQDQTTRSSAA